MRLWSGSMGNESWARGRCACGDVAYELSSPPMITHACHCTDCQRLSGGPVVCNLWIEADRVVRVRGRLATVELPSGSPAGQVVSFCPRCGTQLHTHYRATPGTTLFVRGGTLDDPTLAPPDVHIWTRSRRAWVEPGSAPSFPEFYDPFAVWPSDSLARYRANQAASRA